MTFPWRFEYWPIDIFLFFIMPFLLIPPAIFLPIFNKHVIFKYKSAKMFTIILVPIAFIVSILSWVELIRFFQGYGPIFIIADFQAVISYLVVLFYLIVGFFLLKLFGSNWLLRRKFMFKKNYGPWLIMPKNPSNGIIICGHFSKRILKKIKNEKIDKILKYREENSKDIFKVKYEFTYKGFWKSVLENLEPNTKYEYEDPNPMIKKWFSFKTAYNEGRLNNDEYFEFIAISDMHGSGNDTNWFINLIKFKSKFQKISFIIDGGDFVSDGRIITHWRTVYNQLNNLTAYIPMNHAAGNHDALIPKMVQRWKDILPHDLANEKEGLYHFFIFRNTIFIFLDNYNNGRYDNRLSDIQIRWLRQLLSKLPEYVENKILIFHEPIYSTSTHGCFYELEEQLIPIIEEFQIKTVICGHIHIFEHFHRTDICKPQGVHFFTIGGAGGKLEGALRRKINNPPYLWESDEHRAKVNFYSSGDVNSPKRNDVIVTKYQELGFIKHHFMYVKINNEKISYQIFDKEGKMLYEIEVIL